MKPKDLKLLWGRAAGRCSMSDCRVQLAPKNEAVLFGEMAHIIAQSSTGPRGQPSSPIEIDSYENLILLCPNHHTIVDKNPNDWPADRLLQMKSEHESWVQQKLATGEIQPTSDDILYKLGRIIERRTSLGGLLWADIGNARLLYSLQDQDDYVWLKLNADKAFRDSYLNMLDQAYPDINSTPPFCFSMVDSLIAFPEDYQSYAHKFCNPVFKRSEHPVLIELTKPVKINGEIFLEGGNRTPIPYLPTRNGFIERIDERSGLPISISDEPCAEFWGAYYWVRPSGLRIVIKGIGVLDPMEVPYGTAIWWTPNDARPFFGVRPVRPLTDELRREMHDATMGRYSEMMQRYSGKTWNRDKEKLE
jgi:hypothetical protein